GMARRAVRAADVVRAAAAAADVGRQAADVIFLRDSLKAVPRALAIAREAARLVRQNFGLAIAYNVVAIPVAVLGQVTPFVAAIAMSASSVIVVANALRLRGSAEAVSSSARPEKASLFNATLAGPAE